MVQNTGSYSEDLEMGSQIQIKKEAPYLKTASSYMSLEVGGGSLESSAFLPKKSVLN